MIVLCLKYLCFYFRKIFILIFNSTLNDKLQNLRKLLAPTRKHYTEKTKISVIIPTFNEIDTISETIESIKVDKFVEIIVSDGGSTDSTLEKCKHFNFIKTINKGRNRAQCMNEGAKVSTGEILVFLHADSRLPSNWKQSIIALLNRNINVLVGCFEFDPKSEILKNNFLFTILIYLVHFRTKILNFPYGDQALFFQRDHFFLLGMFPDCKLMEDYELVNIIRNIDHNTVDCVNLPSPTSGRRWEKNGILWNTILNQVIRLKIF